MGPSEGWEFHFKTFSKTSGTICSNGSDKFNSRSTFKSLILTKNVGSRLALEAPSRPVLRSHWSKLLIIEKDVGDGFDRFCHQHPLSFSVGHQPKISDKSLPNFVPNIRHQHACSKSHQFNDSAKSGVKNRRYITIKATFLGQQSVSDNWTWIFIITWYYPVSRKISRSVRPTDLLTACNPCIRFSNSNHRAPMMTDIQNSGDFFRRVEDFLWEEAIWSPTVIPR